MTDKNDLYIYQNRIFDVIIIISWILYFFIALRLLVNAPDYLDDLEYYIKIYVSLFLLYRFMPFRKVSFTDLDKKIAFNAGIFLFTATTINSFLITYIKNIKSYVLSSNNFNWIVK
jgi:hypothetical protein